MRRSRNYNLKKWNSVTLVMPSFSFEFWFHLWDTSTNIILRNQNQQHDNQNYSNYWNDTDHTLKQKCSVVFTLWNENCAQRVHLLHDIIMSINDMQSRFPIECLKALFETWMCDCTLSRSTQKIVPKIQLSTKSLHSALKTTFHISKILSRRNVTVRKVAVTSQR